MTKGKLQGDRGTSTGVLVERKTKNLQTSQTDSVVLQNYELGGERRISLVLPPK